jgi:hypothetical protein
MRFEIYRFANIINLFIDADGIASYFCGVTKLGFIPAEN